MRAEKPTKRKPLNLPITGPTKGQHQRRVKTLHVTNWAKKGLKKLLTTRTDAQG